MNTNSSKLRDVESILNKFNQLKLYSETAKALKEINKAYDKQRAQVEEMYAFFSELIDLLSKVDSKSNNEAQDLAWSIRTALMTHMLKIKSIGEKE